VDDFCIDRQALMPEYLTRVRRSVPPTWKFIGPAPGPTGFTEPNRQANVLGSAESYAGDVRAYATLQGGDLEQEFRKHGYRQLSFVPVRFRTGGSGFQRVFEWTPEKQSRIRQIQLYYVDDCGQAYTFTATSLADTFARYEPLFAEIFSVLIIGVTPSDSTP
jgi:hypothetical protein